MSLRACNCLMDRRTTSTHGSAALTGSGCSPLSTIAAYRRVSDAGRDRQRNQQRRPGTTSVGSLQAGLTLLNPGTEAR